MSYKHTTTVLLLTVLLGGVTCSVQEICTYNLISLQCNPQTPEWIKITGVKGSECAPGDTCSDSVTTNVKSWLKERCTNTSECTYPKKDMFEGSDLCGLSIEFDCTPGAHTTPRSVNTPPPTEDAWKKNYSSWQWAIIFVVIGVVTVALIILVIMLINRCCYTTLNQEAKPNFLEQETPTQSHMGSTLGSRSVSMSTLHMSTLARNTATLKKEVSKEEIDEIKAQFGTARKTKKEEKNMKQFGVDVGTIDSRRSSGDGASGEPNGKLIGDDSSSGIGSVIYERANQALYDPTDTSHDDYITFTMKKQAKSPLVNPQFGTSMSAKKVDPELYKSSAPTVDIIEDNREENFRLDINSWTLNKHKQQNRQQNKQSDTSNISLNMDQTGSDIQLNPE